jgi:para-aminobenzoate synthetase component 1
VIPWDHPELALLHGGPGGWALCTVATPAGHPAPPGPDPRAWAPHDGAVIVQRDYEGTSWTSTPAALLPAPAAPDLPPPRLAAGWEPAWSAEAHQAKVRDIQARIARGDCYQVNLAVPFTARLAAGDDLAVFAALLRASPAPFAAFLRRPGRPTVISHSPENLVAWDGRQAVSSPIKGTRRRELGREDAVRADLLASAKDRAELAMIVDLARNDLGRVAVPGSVRVADPARLLDLPYVHHLVADVVATLRPAATADDLVAALFPAGSITGAPKRMAMEVIAALEGRPRGPYCGAFGWRTADAGQLAVAIRTALVAGDRVTLWAGSGITADSDPAAEWDEVRAKADGMGRVFQ